MTSYLLAGLSIIAVVAVTVAGVQSTRLSSAQADLTTARQELASSEARRQGAESAHRETLEELAAERAAADAAARRIADLRDRIARDAGTDRDAPTAPVLTDTIRSIGGQR